jgi:hypothetical protein
MASYNFVKLKTINLTHAMMSGIIHCGIFNIHSVLGVYSDAVFITLIFHCLSLILMIDPNQ